MNALWATVIYGGVLKSEVLSPTVGSGFAGAGRRIVDVACQSCGERVAAVTDQADGPWLWVWSPTFAIRADAAGEPLWTVAGGPVPLHKHEVGVYCRHHGGGVIEPARVDESIAAYRKTGRRKRFIAELQGA